MYEYVDAQGERVTVRSARTLGALLGDGRITGGTRFRRAEEPAFVAAASHGELRRIAEEFGVRFGPEPSVLAGAPKPETGAAAEPVTPAMAEPSGLAAVADAPAASARMPEAMQGVGAKSVTPLPARPALVPPLVPTLVPALVPALVPPGAPPRRPALAAMAPARLVNPLPETKAMAALRWVCTSLLYSGGAALAAGIVALAALLMTRSRPLAFLVLVGTAFLAGRWAGHRMGSKRLVPPGREAIAGAVMAGIIAGLIAGSLGVLLGAVIGVAMWRKLRDSSVRPEV